jgi:hypothetical protein
MKKAMEAETKAKAEADAKAQRTSCFNLSISFALQHAWG